MPPFYEQWQFWLIFAAWLPYTTFALSYAIRSPWYRWQVGRSLLLSKVIISAVLTNALIGRIWPSHQFRSVVFAVLIGGAVIAGWYQLLTLLELQRARKSEASPQRRATDRK